MNARHFTLQVKLYILSILLLLCITPILATRLAHAEQEVIQTTIAHTKVDGETNKFTFAPNAWSAGSSSHVWSLAPSASLPAQDIWYTVDFVGHKIDVYAGKNRPMGKVTYFIDGQEVGTYSLYNSSNINEILIASFDNLTEGAHTFKAVATGTKDTAAQNTLIDCAKVVVYHRPYQAQDVTLNASTLTLTEGETHQVSYTVTPSYASIDDMQYSSNNNDIATVDEHGLITAGQAGNTSITLSSARTGIRKEIAVTVRAGVPALKGGIASTDTQYTQNRYDEVIALTTREAHLSAWKQDIASSLIALASSGSSLRNLRVQTTNLTGPAGTIDASAVSARFVASTKAYNGRYLGYGDPNRALPPVSATNRSESSDILSNATSVNLGYNKVQPLWLQFAIPADAAAGTYTTSVTVTADGLDAPLVFTYTITVADATLAKPSHFKDNFDIELWQYPYSSAEYYGVEPFSPEHFEILKPIMSLYKQIGGHAITTTISEDAWNGQTYSARSIHYPSMIRWTKQADGSMSYDFSAFDAWVSFCKREGLGDKIVLYSIAPWHNSFTYWENNQLVRERYTVGSERYRTVWTSFLRALIEHLMDRGWFDDAYIGIDERGFSREAFDLIDSVHNIHDLPLKTAGAMDGFVDKPELARRVTDLNVGDTAAAKHPAAFSKLLADRAAKGYRTTLYSCTEHVPGNFSLSAPVESYWSVINAGKETAGFLRWAFDAWVEDPLHDATHNAFEPGDPFLVYPEQKGTQNPQVQASVRLMRMAEGVRDVNKIRQMLAEAPVLQEDVDRLYSAIATQAITRKTYLSADGVAQLSREMTAFKQGIDTLTERYLTLKATGTNTVESVHIENPAQELAVGQNLSLRATVNPSNVLDTRVVWKSSADAIASVAPDGTLTAHRTGRVTISAASRLDSSKTDEFTLTIVPLKVELGLAYYSFDNQDIQDSWGTRHGSIVEGASFEAAGRSGGALRVVDGHGATLPGDAGIGENDPWTVSYWVRTETDFNKRISVLANRDGNFSADVKMAEDRDPGYHVGTRPGDVLTFRTNFVRDTWYHITWTQSKEGGLTMYVNGKAVENNSWSKTNRLLSPLDIIGSTGFTGLIDELKVYKRVLSAAEIQADTLVKGLNISEDSLELFIGETQIIGTNLLSDAADKTISFTSKNPDIAKVDENGIVTGVARGTTYITVANEAGNYTEQVKVRVRKKLSPSSTLPEYLLDQARHVSDVHKETEDTSNQYFGQPDMIRTKTGRLITSFPQGHGKGPLIMKISDDNGETWARKTDIPSSWAGSQETPTMYALTLPNGNERLMLITACPGWGTDSDGNQHGWNTSYSDDNGNTWTEYKHWHSSHANGTNNRCIVGMASLIQLKDETGKDIPKWLGIYHDHDYINYKTYLTFDEQGNEQWSEPEPYLSAYRSMEQRYQMCEIGLFRAPDNKRIVGLVRSQSHNHPATLIYSDDEGMTWSEPMELPGSLAGERHKMAYDPISGRLVVTFRQIKYDLNNNGRFDGNSDWTCGEWVAWVGSYEDLMNQNDGDYLIVLAEDWSNNAKSGDTGYAGVVVLKDGTFIMDSYGHWDKDYSHSWGGGVTTDRCYIKQAKFKLGDVENAQGLVSRNALEASLDANTNLAEADYSPASWLAYTKALEAARAGMTNTSLQQIEIDALVEALADARAALTAVGTPLMHRVVFKVNGQETLSLMVKDGDTLTEPQAPVHEGYRFEYWTLDTNATFFRRAAALTPAPFDFSTPIHGPITLRAVFSKLPDTNHSTTEEAPAGNTSTAPGTTHGSTPAAGLAGTDGTNHSGKAKTAQHKASALPASGDMVFVVIGVVTLAAVGLVAAGIAGKWRKKD
ncbi:Ig-like domain-containing protein [Collinsella sp. zg1085]|uniref:glycoside hydrolase domain-containing protein n=1 Tax=Collinsella sp. zg1085 TaxID=2844380 RepID=UPI001C0C4535|nr:glycoside hydrolase domain-containing protein [Collinsella sp. zg1085]QWT17714.1 Ig-like domain-containing protein [Collinsella sp. zg1085]